MADHGAGELPQSKEFNQPYSARNKVPRTEDLKKERPEQGESGADAAGEKGGASQKINDVPISNEKTNVLFHPTPEVDLQSAFALLEKETDKIGIIVGLSIVGLNWLLIGGGFSGLVRSVVPAVGVAFTIVYIMRNVMPGPEQSKSAPSTERLKYVPESVEWMNSLVNTLWTVIGPDFFRQIAQQIDDTVSGFIPTKAVRVNMAELGLGTTSVRVLSMRSLPDEEFGQMVPSHGMDKNLSQEEKRQREEAAEREEGGIFYNLEVSVAYHGAPFAPKKDQLHCDIMINAYGARLPIYIRVNEFTATIRLRIQMHAFMPFLQNVTFALTEPPAVHSSVRIGAPWAMNLVNLPIVDSVIRNQIFSASKDLVQPKSMSLDMTQYLGGTEFKNETESVGVLYVRVHGASNLAKQDTRGPGADPYLTIAFSKYEKPMFATRVIKGDLNPIWEQAAFIMIKPEHMKRQEDVLLRLWDSDMSSADDICGHVQFPLQELVVNAGKMFEREDQLDDEIGGDSPGKLRWEVGYFPRTGFKKSLRTNAQDPRDRHGNPVEVPEEQQTQNALNTRPDPEYRPGVLSVTVQQLINVDIPNPNKKSLGKVKDAQQNDEGEDVGEEEQDIGYLPSLYATIHVNDELVYRTRVKAINSSPTFNSNVEYVVSDWQSAIVRVAAWDTRKSDEDALVGAAEMKLTDILTNSCAVTDLYTLRGGQGTGRMRVGLLFRGVQLDLPKNMRGFAVGRFEFTSPLRLQGDLAKYSKLRIRTGGSFRRLEDSAFTKNGSGGTWNLDFPNNILPVSYRYSSPIAIEFKSSGLPRESVYAVTWLFNLVDGEPTEFDVPIYKTDYPSRLLQNAVSPDDPHMKLERLGSVRFSGLFHPGLSPQHGQFADSSDAKQNLRVYEACTKQ